MTRFVEHNGYVWPASDKYCFPVVFDMVEDMLPALSGTEGRRVAVQAGGNTGVWAAWLAERFERVYTVEPDPINYHCLERNVPGNVWHRQAAFGERPGKVGLHADPANIGAHYIDGKGEIPVVTIDSYALGACDYICLDVEGYELRALRGAVETIRAHRPTIQIEDKGLSRKYGAEKGDAEAWLAAEFGYQVVERVHRDVILAAL